MINRHVPILTPVIIDYLKPAPGKLMIDATLGDAGHTLALLKAGCRVLAFDQDAEAITRSLKFIHRELPNAKVAVADTTLPSSFDCLLVRRSFTRLAETAADLNINSFDGILFDLGVSTHQLKSPGRGFSLKADAPLDMRMDSDLGVTAADLLAALSARELAAIFMNLADETYAKKIAAEIVSRRLRQPLTTTGELARLVEKVKPARGRTHPATKVFQALRMVVNLERDALISALPQAVALLKKQGILAVISFHSIEDRLVKDYLLTAAASGDVTLATPKPITPDQQEIINNPRSRSAKLRIAVKQ